MQLSLTATICAILPAGHLPDFNSNTRLLGRRDDFGEGDNDVNDDVPIWKKKEGMEAGSTCGYSHQGMFDLHPCFLLSDYRKDWAFIFESLKLDTPAAMLFRFTIQPSIAHIAWNHTWLTFANHGWPCWTSAPVATVLSATAPHLLHAPLLSCIPEDLSTCRSSLDHSHSCQASVEHWVQIGFDDDTKQKKWVTSGKLKTWVSLIVSYYYYLCQRFDGTIEDLEEGLFLCH